MNGVVWAVIRREYLQRVHSRWFILATVAAPLLLVGLMAVSILMATGGQETTRTVAVLDRTSILQADVEAGLVRAGYIVGSTAGEGEEALAQRVRDGDLGGFFVLDEATLEAGVARFVTESEPSLVRRVALQQAVAQAALSARLGGDDAAVRSLLSGGELRVDLLSGEGGGRGGPAFAMAYAGSFLLYMTIIVYAVTVMRSVMEEKSNRVVEVVISSMRPFQLMLGKILGVGAVGLTQLGIWAAMALVAGLVGLPLVLAANPDLAQLAEVSEYLPGVGYVALFLVFFLGGYFLFSAAYAAVGAMCNTEEEAQQAQWPVVLFLMVPVVFMSRVIEAPGDPLAVGLSLFPPFTPVLMFARAAAGGAPAWQIAVSVAGMAVAVVVVAWVAGRIYKVGILMAGKRPTLPELVRWVREA